MTDPQGTQDETNTHVIERGMRVVTATTYPDGEIVVEKQKRRHKFGEGYQPVGPSRELYSGHCMDAALVADVLRQVFESDE